MNDARCCRVKTGDKKVEAKFYGIFQAAAPVRASALVYGPPAGQVSQPVAVVEYNGQLHKVEVESVYFDDMKPEMDYDDLREAGMI